MRNTYNLQAPLTSVLIEKIQLDAKCRDDVTKTLRGLQSLYSNPHTRKELFLLLEQHFCPQTDHAVGRPGLDAWQVVVLAIFKHGVRCDFDRLRNYANEHCKLRQMLGHGSLDFDLEQYSRQRLIDNIALLSPQLLGEISQLIVKVGHQLCAVKLEAPLKARCDSFVVETDVHFPTDCNLLRDALRFVMRDSHKLCNKYGVQGWRQHKHLVDKMRRLFLRVCHWRLWNTRPEAVEAYLEFGAKMLDKSSESLCRVKQTHQAKSLLESEHPAQQPARIRLKNRLQLIERRIELAQRLMGQIDRRILKGETIPHEEKIFSIFEPYTRWCSKGKAGRPVELGVPVAVVEDQHQFLIGHQILWRESDVEVAVPLIESCQQTYPKLNACSFDRGFHSRSNRARLDELLQMNALPKKGRLSPVEKAREQAPEFANARRQHPAVESAINHLEHRGLDRVRNRGKAGFERTVALAILAANCHRVGALLQERERKKRMRLAA